MKDKIAQFIYNYLDWAYCDNCRYNFEDSDNVIAVIEKVFTGNSAKKPQRS